MGSPADLVIDVSKLGNWPARPVPSARSAPARPALVGPVRAGRHGL